MIHCIRNSTSRFCCEVKLYIGKSSFLKQDHCDNMVEGYAIPCIQNNLKWEPYSADYVYII